MVEEKLRIRQSGDLPDVAESVESGETSPSLPSPCTIREHRACFGWCPSQASTCLLPLGKAYKVCKYITDTSFSEIKGSTGRKITQNEVWPDTLSVSEAGKLSVEGLAWHTFPAWSLRPLQQESIHDSV